jgi:hypothetical protein
VTSFTAEVPKGKVEKVNFPGVHFYLKYMYALSSPGPGLLESGVQMKMHNTDHLETRELKFCEVSL